MPIRLLVSIVGVGDCKPPCYDATDHDGSETLKVTMEKTNSTQTSLGDMPAEDFRRYGHQLIDWIADFLANVGDHPAFPNVRPGEIRSKLPASPPIKGEAVAPEMRRVLDGCALADSMVVNPHKWLFVPLDLSVLYTRKRETLRR